ncbi:carbamoyl phosphate synthase small subunit [Bacillus safensis FO-36b] [Bacillus safensis subsp. safensis]
MKRRLVLENGTVFEGTGFGSLKNHQSEKLRFFNTGMTGYQEILF